MSITIEQRMQAIYDLAAARLRNPQDLTPNVEHDLKAIVDLATIKKPRFCKHCPFAEHVHPAPGCAGFEPREDA